MNTIIAAIRHAVAGAPWRPGAGRGAAGLVLALAGTGAIAGLAGCATNPATGNQFFSLMSPQEEKQIGAEQHPELVQEFGGEIDNAELQAYVSSVGNRLAKASDLPNLNFTFTVLDTPIVNAFALPGGYVHVTRGLLALADNEAEMAGVLAHEIGHVTARHSAQRYSRGVLAQVGATALGLLTGNSAIANLAGTGAQIYLQSYSREQEFQADKLGIRYMKRAGYDPSAMATFLSSMEAYTRLQNVIAGKPADAADEFSIMSTHPRTVDRVQQAEQAAGGAHVANATVNRDVYLRKIAGMVYGNSPEQGFVRENTFLHPKLRIRFEVPKGFELNNTPEQVIATGPGSSLVIFDTAARQGAPSPLEYITGVWAKGVPLGSQQTFTVNGLTAATAAGRANTNQGPMDVRLLAISGGPELIYRFMFLAPPNRTTALNEAFRSITSSFRQVSAAEAAQWKPLIVTLHTVAPGDTVESLARQWPFDDYQVERFRVLNSIGQNETLEPGQLVKMISKGQ